MTSHGNRNGNGNRWLSPGVVFGVLGMAGAVGAAWMGFESRVTKIETAYSDVYRRLGQIEGKLDDLILERRKNE